MFRELHTAVFRETFSRFAAKCVCVQTCMVLIVEKIFEEFCPDMRIALQL